MYNVRVAIEEDVSWIRDVAARRMLEEELFKPAYFNPEAVEKLIRLGIASNTMWVVLKNNSLVGALGALEIPTLFNPNIISLSEVFWWVNPDNRMSRAGLLLLNTFMDAAKKYEEASLSLLSTSMVMNESIAKRGFRLREFGFYKES